MGQTCILFWKTGGAVSSASSPSKSSSISSAKTSIIKFSWWASASSVVPSSSLIIHLVGLGFLVWSWLSSWINSKSNQINCKSNTMLFPMFLNFLAFSNLFHFSSADINVDACHFDRCHSYLGGRAHKFNSFQVCIFLLLCLGNFNAFFSYNSYNSIFSEVPKLKLDSSYLFLRRMPCSYSVSFVLW